MKTIKRNVLEKIAENLPNVSVINARSLWPKLKSFAIQFHESDTNLAILTEIWGKGSKVQLQQIKHLLEIKGIDFIFGRGFLVNLLFYNV